MEGKRTTNSSTPPPNGDSAADVTVHSALVILLSPSGYMENRGSSLTCECVQCIQGYERSCQFEEATRMKHPHTVMVQAMRYGHYDANPLTQSERSRTKRQHENKFSDIENPILLSSCHPLVGRAGNPTIQARTVWYSRINRWSSPVSLHRIRDMTSRQSADGI